MTNNAFFWIDSHSDLGVILSESKRDGKTVLLIKSIFNTERIRLSIKSFIELHMDSSTEYFVIGNKSLHKMGDSLIQSSLWDECIQSVNPHQDSSSADIKYKM
jgi:hypothetical protein